MEIINANSRNMNMLNNLLSERRAIIFFVAPWCGHCKQLEPTIDSLMGRFKNYKSPGVIARVEESEIPKFKYDNEIRGYPTIRVMSNGKTIKDYEGPRDEKSIAEMLLKYFNKKTLKAQVDKEKEKKVKKKTKKKRKKKRNVRKSVNNKRKSVNNKRKSVNNKRKIKQRQNLANKRVVEKIHEVKRQLIAIML